MGSGTSGSFSKVVASLEPGTTYYYRAYVRIGTDEYHYGEVKSFKTYSISWQPYGDASAYASSFLGGYEVPATDVSLSSGQSSHSTVQETYGNTDAYIFNTSSSSQLVVTHTFSYNSKELANYTMLYDQNKRCALWSAFEMNTTDFPDKGAGRHDDWAYDPAIPQSWQPYLKNTYSGSYTRGHQVASNDRQTTVAQNQQTFYYSNMTPQTSSLNSGIWSTLESNVQGLLSKISQYQRIYVVTGPIFDSGYSSTTDYNSVSCAVPTRYYKCVMRCTFDSNGNMTGAVGAGYLFNHSSPSRTDTTIDAIEKITGFDFFANVPTEFQDSAEENSFSFFKE